MPVVRVIGVIATIFIMIVGCTNSRNKQEQNMTALPFLKDLIVVSTNVVDSHPIYDVHKQQNEYNTGDIVQLNGRVVEIDKIETNEIYFSLPLCNIWDDLVGNYSASSIIEWDGTEGVVFRRHCCNITAQPGATADACDEDWIFTKNDELSTSDYIYYDVARDVYEHSEDCIRGDLDYSTTWTVKLCRNFIDTITVDNGHFLEDGVLKKGTKNYGSYFTFYDMYGTNPTLPFDDIGTTQATRDDSLTYTVRPQAGDSYVAVVLDGVVGTAVTITIDAVQTSYALEQCINGETVFHYISDVNTPITSDVTITVINAGEVAKVGGISLAKELRDMGITKFDLSLDTDDYSPYEVKKGGYVDYVEGVVLGSFNVDIVGTVAELPHIFKSIKEFKKTRMGWDLTDSYMQTNPLAKILRCVGRVDESSISLAGISSSIELDDIFEGKFVIKEAS